MNGVAIFGPEASRRKWYEFMFRYIAFEKNLILAEDSRRHES